MFQDIKDFEDLENRLRNWKSFGDGRSDDTNGMVYLFLACLDNLERYFPRDDIDSMPEFFNQKQKDFLLKIAQVLVKD